MILYAPDSTPAATEPADGSAVMEVRNLILERKGETGLVDDLQIRAFVRRANRKVWNRAIKRNPAPWETRTGELVFPVADGKVSLDVLGGLAPEDTADLALQMGAATVARVRYLEVAYIGGWYPVFEGVGEERYVNEPGYPLPYAAPRLPAYFYIEGNAIFFSRTPSTDLTFRAVIVPVMPDPADSEDLLYGRFPNHHDLVVTEAARLCFSRDEKAKTPWDSECAELWADFNIALSEGQGSRPRRVGARQTYYP